MASASVTRMLSFAKKYGTSMVTALNNSPVFFAVMLVQACNESGYGTSYSAVHRNNFFGIMENRRNRNFNSPTDCFSYYVNLLTTKPIYQVAGVGSALDPYKQIRAIANAGYYDGNNDATLPKSQLPPNKIWTAQQSADHYYATNKSFLDGVLLSLPIGRVSNQNIASATASISSLIASAV